MPGNIPKTIRLYRILHIDNLCNTLQFGICNKNHVNANPDYVPIGSADVIGKRTHHPVKIKDYGRIGDYVPFYFTPCSIMLFNILTGHNVQRCSPGSIVHVLCNLESFIQAGIRYFFTDGQANTAISKHLYRLEDLQLIDWEVISSGDFKKTEKDPDRTRRYQAEFLIRNHVPVNHIKEIVVYDKSCATFAKEEVQKANLSIPVSIKKAYYFNR